MSGGEMQRDPDDPIGYLLGEFDDEHRAAFEARLRSDGELREHLADAESLVVALRELPGEGPPSAPARRPGPR